MKTTFRSLFPLGLIFSLSACAFEPAQEFDEEVAWDEDISTTEQAIGESGCASNSLTPDATFTGSIFPDWKSLTAYSKPGCADATVVHINNVNSSQNGTHMGVRWDGIDFQTKATCEKETLRSILYRRSGSSWVKVADLSSRGSWVNMEGTYFCHHPGATFNSYVVSGATYRIVSSAKQGMPSSPLILSSSHKVSSVPAPVVH